MATTDTARTDAKAGVCSMCRSGTHALCARGDCVCPASTCRGRRYRDKQRAEVNPAPAPIQRARKAAPAPAKDRPVFRLVKEAPPAPARKVGLSDHLLPLLVEIPGDDFDWYSVAETPSPRAAGHMVGRCRKLGIPGWEWAAADGKVYVRRKAQ